MACLQLLKSSPQTQFECNFCPESKASAKRRISWLRSSGSGLNRRRIRISCNAGDGGDSKGNGEQAPESLFTKELKKRGMKLDALLDEKNRSSSMRKEEVKSREEDGGWSYSRRNGVTTDAESNESNQREKSMALNSEGLEGLIPRAKALLTLGGTFFLGFWPLILVTVASFSALYLYFGTEFVHDGNTRVASGAPPYVDPYELLEEDRIYKTAPPINWD